MGGIGEIQSHRIGASPSIEKGMPGRTATSSFKACPNTSMEEQAGGSVTQMNIPPGGGYMKWCWENLLATSGASHRTDAGMFPDFPDMDVDILASKIFERYLL